MTEAQPQPQPQPTAARPQGVAPPAARMGGGAYEPFDPRHKSTVLASVLSFMPGLGQVYVGYYQRGFAHALVITTLIAMLATDDLRELTPFVALFMVFFWLYNIVDAGRRAAFYNRALAEGENYEPAELPGDVASSPHGNLVGGTIMVVVGFVLLLHTRFDVGLEWIEDWWPAAPMVLGAYLIVMAIQERRNLASAES